MSGELAALAAAACWAIAARSFRRLGDSCPPFTLNLWKGLLAIPGLLLLSWFAGERGGLPARDVLLLLASGAAGIGIGDSCFFAAVNRVGDRLAVLVAETVAPAAAATLAALALGEWLPPLRLAAVATILAGVTLSLERAPRQESGNGNRVGLLFALGAALAQAAGIVGSREVMRDLSHGAGIAAAVRLAGGLVCLFPLLLATGSPALPRRGSDGRRPWFPLALATFIGTLAALGFMMVALERAEAAVVQTLLAASALFSLLLAARAGEPVSRRAVAGALVALLGVALLLSAG